MTPETVHPLNGFPLAPPAAGEEAAFLAALEETVAKIARVEMALTTWYVRLGQALNIVEDKLLWRDRGFRNFKAYRDYLQDDIGMGRTRIFTARAVAKLGGIAEEKLEKVTIGNLEVIAKHAPAGQLEKWVDKAAGMKNGEFAAAMATAGLVAQRGDCLREMLTVLVTREQAAEWRRLVADPQVQARLGTEGPAPALLLEWAMDLVWAEVTAPTLVLPPGATAEAEHVGYVMAGEEPES